jgi:hypothetical protein
VGTHEQLVRRVDLDIDDALAALTLVTADASLTDRVWSQLVDLLVESMLLDLRGEMLTGRLDRRAYTRELEDLAGCCRAAGLLPLRSRRG